MNIRPLTESDIETIGIEPEFQAMLADYVRQYGCEYGRIGDIDGKAIFAAGVRPFWDGVGEIWIRVFDESHAIGIIRAAKELMAYLTEHYRFHRLQATVRADDTRTLKFDQYMGFEIECTVGEFYSDRCDAVILRYKHGN